MLPSTLGFLPLDTPPLYHSIEFKVGQRTSPDRRRQKTLAHHIPHDRRRQPILIAHTRTLHIDHVSYIVLAEES